MTPPLQGAPLTEERQAVWVAAIARRPDEFDAALAAYVSAAYAVDFSTGGRPAAEPPDVREALKPFAHFAEMWAAKPLNRAGSDHIVYGIHTGTEWAAELKLGDFMAARAALGAAPPTGYRVVAQTKATPNPILPEDDFPASRGAPAEPGEREGET